MYTTASQTIGPYLHIGLEGMTLDNLAAPGVAGEVVTVQGRVVDGDGQGVNDAVIEIWQADAQGNYPDRAGRDKPGFRGFGRVFSDDDGRFRFTTIKPGRVPAAAGGLQAPHLNVVIFMRGLLRHLVTRMYFDDPSNADDEALARVPPERRHTLVARPAGERSSSLQWNVVLQGDGETVFFDA